MKPRYIRLKIPFYKQRYDFSCGPASLMMAMKFLDRDLKINQELEMDIWREANMLESYGTSRFGLAFSAAKRGFRVKVYSNIRGAGFVKKVERLIGRVDFEQLDLFLQDRRKRSVGLGAKEFFVSNITEDLLRKTLSSGWIPIVLSNAEFFGAEDLPHWVVISGIDAGSFYVDNPLGNKESRIPLTLLRNVVGFKGDECMVAISGSVRNPL